LLSQLGFKIYFFRPFFKKKTVEDLKNCKGWTITREKTKTGRSITWLPKFFDAAPQTDDGIIILDEKSGIPKIKWNQTKDEDSVLDCISNLLIYWHLFEDCKYFLFKDRKSTKINANNNKNDDNNDNETHNDDTSELFIQTEQIDYEIEPSVTEDAAWATIQLET
jgi:hypothetical protein